MPTRKQQQSEINFKETKKRSQSFRTVKQRSDKENENPFKFEHEHSMDDMSLPTPVRRSSRKNPTAKGRVGSSKPLLAVPEKENQLIDSDDSDIQVVDDAPLKTPRSNRTVSRGKLDDESFKDSLENDENKENVIDLTKDYLLTKPKSTSQQLPEFTIKSSLKSRNAKVALQPKEDAVLCTKTSCLNRKQTDVKAQIGNYSKGNSVENVPVLPLTPPEEPVPMTNSVKFVSPLKRSDAENRPMVPFTPQNQKSLRRSIVESNSLTCSAVGRKRRILFPGYEYYQEMKSAFCPKQQVLCDDYTNLDNNMLTFDGKASGNRSVEAEEIIPGREDEIDRLQILVNQVVSEGKSASLYISGPPGTGKSACVTAVLQELLSKRGKDIAIVKIVNCVRCRTQQSILEALGCNSDGMFTDKKLQKSGSSKGQRPFIVVLDEVDQVEINHHSFIYKMFEWVHESNSRSFLLIAIANALDLTERVLPRLALSSVKPQLMHYKPYSGPQIVKIIQDRISKVNSGMGVQSGISGDQNSTSQPLLDRGAIELCARKVASSTGDARKALELCRKAIESVQREAMNQYNAIQALDTPPRSPRLDQENRNPSASQAINYSGHVTSRVTISVMNKVISDSLTSWASAQSGSVGSLSSRVNSDGMSGSSVGGNQDSCPLHHKVVITSLARLTKQSSAAYFNMHQVLAKYASVCNEKAISTLDQSQLHMVMNLLEARGLIQLTAPGNRKMGTCDLRNMKVHVKGNLFELLSSSELDV